MDKSSEMSWYWLLDFIHEQITQKLLKMVLNLVTKELNWTVIFSLKQRFNETKVFIALPRKLYEGLGRKTCIGGRFTVLPALAGPSSCNVVDFWYGDIFIR